MLSTELGSSRTSLQPWVSGALAAALPGGRWALQAEVGAHRVGIRHVTQASEAGAPERTRHLDRWEPLFQLVLRRDLY